MKEIRIVLTGGGTGGHFFPLLAVASELRNLASELRLVLGIYYVGPLKGPFVIDEALFREQGIIPRGIGAASGIRGLGALVTGMFQSLWQIYWIMPDVIFSKGGYGSLPVIIASIIYRIPILIHESDAIPGKVNEAAARFASKIAVSFEKTLGYFPKEKTAVLGNPVRRNLVPLPERSKAIEFFEFDPGRRTILVTGGSQGAKALNDLILDLLPDLLKKYQVIHQCGPKNFQALSQESKFILEKNEAEKYYKLYGFLMVDDLKDAYAASDLVLARAGSGQIFELALVAKPSILVPFRYASKDHQRENAYSYASSGGAVVIEEENLTPHILLSTINNILNDQGKIQTMAKSALSFSKPEAGLEIAQKLLSLARVNI